MTVNETYKELKRQGYVKQYEELTANNEHVEALKVVCEYFNSDLNVKKLIHINALHDLYENPVPELQAMRNEIENSIRKLFYTKFLKTIKPEDY